MIKLALVGSGQMASNYLKILENSKKVKITSIYSKTNKNLRKIHGDYFKTTDIKTLLSKKFDGVIIATPASTHFDLTNFFLKKGFPTLVEKPLTTSLRDAKRLKKIPHKNKLMVGHTLLFHPAYLELKRRLKNKKIRSINFQGYNNKPRKDVSLLWDWGPHPAALFLDLLGILPKKVIVEKNSKKELILLFQFEKNILAKFGIGWNKSNKIRSLQVITDNEKLTFDDMKYPKYEVSSLQGFNINYPRIDSTPPLDNLIKEFVKLIQKKTVLSDLNFGVDVIKFLEICEDSLKKRKS